MVHSSCEALGFGITQMYFDTIFHRVATYDLVKLTQYMLSNFHVFTTFNFHNLFHDY